MRTLYGLLWADTIFRACCAATEASIYFSSVRQDLINSQPRTISPKVARLLLAQRLGLSEFHDLGDVDEHALRILNDYGKQESDMFGERDESGFDTLLYVVEGVQHPEDIFYRNENASLLIKDPPSLRQNAQLLDDFTTQAQHAFSQHPAIYVDHLTGLQGLSRKDGDSYKTAIRAILSILHHPVLPPSSHTVILMPPSFHKTSKGSPYGSYTVLSTLKAGHAKRAQQEEPLEPLPSNTAGIRPFPIAQSSDEDTNTSSPSPSPLPSGVLRQCYKTPELAERETNNCSSHGTVYLRARGTRGTEHNCYACKCHSTVTTSPGSKNPSTLYWGGAACQKKDVSMPFWLLGGVTVFLVAIVSWGVGLLLAMGSEDLPSVIGAGVAGPTAGK